MANGAFVRKDFIVVSTLKGLVAKEMDLIKVFGFDELETVGLVPTGREDIERDLASDTECEIQIGKLFLHGGHHLLADVVLHIEHFIVVALFSGAVPADGRNVEHSATKLNECPALCDCNNGSDDKVIVTKKRFVGGFCW